MEGHVAWIHTIFDSEQDVHEQEFISITKAAFSELPRGYTVQTWRVAILSDLNKMFTKSPIG